MRRAYAFKKICIGWNMLNDIYQTDDNGHLLEGFY